MNKPTAMPSVPPGEVATPKPTVMQGEPATPATAPAAARKPTAMPMGVPVQQALQPTPAKTIAVSKPTAVPGAHRTRIVVTAADLQRLNPASSLASLEQAVWLIDTTNVDCIADREAVLWGQDLQERYAEMVNACLDCSRDRVLVTVMKYVNRTIDILGAIDLKKVCGLEGGGLFGFLHLSSDAIDSPRKLGEARKELRQLVKNMTDRIDKLLELKERIDAAAGGITAIGVEVEASAIAAAFISDHLQAMQPPKESLSRIFLERSGSLTQTLAQIGAGGSIRDMQIEQPIKLIEAVQHATLVALPGWLTGIVALMTMLERQRQPNVTEVDELSEQTKTIIESLQPQGETR